MTLEIRPVGSSFAQEVVGAQLWRGLTASELDQLRTVWADCGVLIFRRQSLSEEELVAFSAGFGVPETVLRKEWVSAEHPEIILVSNMKDVNNRPIGMPGSGDVDWHTDQSYVLEPATGAALYAVEIPKDGGSTYWANLRLAYDALPRRLKEAVEGRRAIFSYAKRLSGYDEGARTISDEVKRKTPDITHALVHRHPVTGKQCLYLDPGTTTNIEGMDPEAGMALLEELRAAATRPEFVYRHEWQVGDVVLWDNGFLLHRRDQYESSQRRFHKRTTIRLPAEHHIVPDSRRAAAG
jgi:alpha-ketoglutarate-dependent taurine dioxygenase